MNFLSPSSLPADLQGARYSPAQLQQTLPWLDISKLPPLPIGGSWIDAETALTLAHDVPKFRIALKKHSNPEALDRFAAAFSVQFLRVEKYSPAFAISISMVLDLGGHETASAVAAALTNQSIALYLRNAAADIVARVGNKTHLPALSLRLMRLQPGIERNLAQRSFAQFTKRLALPDDELEDWSLADGVDPTEFSAVHAAQRARLERAMLTGRLWRQETFDCRIARHPVMAPLAAGLVWGCFDDAGRLLLPFVIASNGDYPAPPSDASVGIVHPAHLAPEDLVHWKEESAKLKAPFPQFGPPARVLSHEETQADQITRLPATTMSAARLLIRLEALGWQRPKAATRLEFHTRAFDGLGVTAVIRYTGIPLVYPGEWGDQSIVSCHFENRQKQLPLLRVSPIAISAVLADLETLGKREALRR